MLDILCTTMKRQEILFETCDIYPELPEVCLDQHPLQTESEHLKSWLVQTFLPDILVLFLYTGRAGVIVIMLGLSEGKS